MKEKNSDLKLKNNMKEKIKDILSSRYKRMLILIFIIATLLRLIYILKIDPTKNQHDLGVENGVNGIGYYQSIYQKHQLPQSNNGQFYHPPLHYILGSIWMIPFSVYTESFTKLVSYTKYLTLIYSLIAMVLFYKILKELHIRDKYKLAIFAIYSLLPINIIITGTLNNDCLAYTLTIWTFLRLIKWHKNDNMKNTALLAVSVGLGVMTKTSCALLAIPIICVFIDKFIREIKKHKTQKGDVCKKYILKYIFFGTISLPIGLWYHVRNLIKFGQPILYVLNIRNKELYTGDYSNVQRFLPDIKELSQMFANPFKDHNIPVYSIKTFLFGEWNTWNKIPILYYISFICACVLAIIVIVLTVINMYKKSKRNLVWRVSFVCLALFNILSFIKMNIDLPYGCSMDFRYLLCTIVTSILLVYFELIIVKYKHKKLANVLFYIVFISAIMMIVAANIIIIATPSYKLSTY